MYYHVYFFAPLFFLRPVAGVPPLRGSVNGKPNDAGSLPSTPLVSSLTPATTDSHVLSSFSPPPVSQSEHPLGLAASVTPRLDHHPTATHANPAATKIPQSVSTSTIHTSHIPTHPPPITSLSTQSPYSQQRELSSASVSFESTDFAFGRPSASSDFATASSSSAAPKIRFALIGVLAGVPLITILGFIITFRWRRTRQARELGMRQIPSDSAELGSDIKEKKGARFSSFFGVSSGAVAVDKNRVRRHHLRPVYASSIHSTAGLAGVGAHRGASASSAPPMIHYINVTEAGSDGESETKANFDNPFGTPPPIRTGFITAPSRVSPHLPHTPPPQLLNLPRPIVTRQDFLPGPAISHPITTTSHSAPRYGSHSQIGGQIEPYLETIDDPLPTRVQCHPLPPTSPGLLSPDITNHIQTHMRNHKHLPPMDRQRRATPDVRMSVATSIYGGLASPRSLIDNTIGAPDPSSHLPQSPRPDQTPVLPYLLSPVSGSETPNDRRQGAGPVGPVIVIEAASPTFDSESEYGDTDIGEDAGGLSVNAASAHARRTGLIGSPHGFVPPSSTSSSVSSYSISGCGPGMSSSSSTIKSYEPSTSSDLTLATSGSDDSSVTVKAAMFESPQALKMRSQAPEGVRHPNISVNSWSRLPRRDVSQLEQEGLRGIAF